MVSVLRSVTDTLTFANNPEQWSQQIFSQFDERVRSQLQFAFDQAKHLYGDATLPLTGESLFKHAVASAALVVDLDLLPDAVIATLLFAVADFRRDWQEWLTETFGSTVAMLVEGVCQVQRLTELARIDKLNTPEEQAQQAETMRKMLLAMVRDIRIVLIKLAWRTQTMHQLFNCPNENEKQRIAHETMDIFAPLANRLGVWQLKWVLEDLGFRYLHPDDYKQIARLLEERRLERLDYIETVLKTLRDELNKAGIHGDIVGRPKHIYSIWKKMTKKKLAFSELYDIRAVRILVDSVSDCYSVLGVIHGLWQPVPGEFDDYISHPKANNYKSLHTAVIGPEDKALEVQIRTFEMHKHAEFGVAAHWKYKEGGKGDAAYEEKIAWLRQLLDWREDLSGASSKDLAEAFKTELFTDTIYVLTPAGKVLSLPAGATPIDFAYSIHSQLGHRCRGAKVNCQIVPLSTPLQSGQRVEILVAKEGGPSVNWLHDEWVKSHRAITKIRQYIRQQNVDSIRENGRLLFDRELSKHLHKPNFQALAEKLGFEKIDDVYLSIGHGELTTQAIGRAIGNLIPQVPVSEDIRPEMLVKQSKSVSDAKGVIVEGVDNLMTVLAKCCHPAPPDDIVGFVTRGRGISIHRTDCPELKRLAQQNPERLTQVDWGAPSGSLFPVDLEVTAHDRLGILRDISDALAREKANVIALNLSSKDSNARFHFTIEVQKVQELDRIFSYIMNVPDVLNVRRV